MSTAGGSLDDRATDVDIDANGNIYVLGTFFTTTTFGTLKLTSAGSTDVFLAKYNNVGTLLWAKQFGGTGEDRAGTLQVGPQQNIYITGSFKNTAKFGPTSLKSSGDFDIFASKISSSGNLLWIKKAGGTGFDLGVDLALDVDPNGKGVCYIVGQYSATATFGTTQLTSAGSQDVFVARLSATNGSFSWTQAILNGTSEITSHSIIVDPNRAILITGSYLGNARVMNSDVVLTNSGSRDIFVVKLSNNGVQQWARKVGSNGEESALQVETQISSDLTLIGYSKSQTLVFGSTTLTGKGKAFLFVAKLSSFGNWLWAKKAGNDLHESFAQGVTVEPFGDSYITGLFSGVATFGTTTLTSKGNFDIFVAKIDNKGNFQWAERAGGSQRDSGNSILYSGKNFFVVGEFEGTSTIGSQSLTSKGRKDYFLWRFSRP